MRSSIRLSKSTLRVLQFLDGQDPMPPRDISKESRVPLRTVTFALDRLVGNDLCQKIPNLGDMRRTLYVINQEKARAVFTRYGMRIS
jgi:DNA-binding MarR family transcriptional regulator